MKKTVRLFALLLAMLMLCTTFLFGCSGETQTATAPLTGNVTIGGTSEDKNDIFDAEIVDLQGYEFVFYVRDITNKHLQHNEVWNDGTSTDKVDQAVFTRNALLERDFNCKIVQEKAGSDPSAAIADSLMSGDYVCDFISLTATQTVAMAKKSLLVDFASLENIDLEKNWYNQEALQGMNMNGKIFHLMGDGLTIDDRWCGFIYYNKELVEMVEEDVDLYQEVRDGKWTVDRMLELIEATSRDLDGDGVVQTYGKDRVGYMAGNTIGNWAHVAATGTYLCDFDEITGEPIVPLVPKRELLDVWAALRPIITTPYRFLNDGGFPSGTTFRSGLVTFYGCNLGAILNWGDQEYSLGILPYPKLNVEQEHYWLSGHYSAGGYAMPINADAHPAPVFEAAGFTSADEMRAYFMEAFFYYSRDTLTPAFFEQVVNKQYAMDEDTAEMIELGLSHIVFDPVVLYNFGGMRTLFRDCGGINDSFGTDVNYDKFQSEYETRVTKARQAVTDYLTFIELGDLA